MVTLIEFMKAVELLHRLSTVPGLFGRSLMTIKQHLKGIVVEYCNENSINITEEIELKDDDDFG